MPPSQLAEQIGVPLYKTEVKELENANFVANNPDRCYHCKTGLYSHLQQLAKELGYPYILDGSNMDDLGDYRPGLQAKNEQGVRSTLQEVRHDQRRDQTAFQRARTAYLE